MSTNERDISMIPDALRPGYGLPEPARQAAIDAEKRRGDALLHAPKRHPEGVCRGTGRMISALRAKAECPECGALFQQQAGYTCGMNLWAIPEHFSGAGETT